ncbi:hexokinase [Polyrhizophydium stewartii]|uniref:Phosphotransferase n=1 Tax=Polyrhizophydium stewartii TaxID=2732419 RepID=A0ABR4N100_9FUNG|nr:hexokinase A [Polyrhizophydium stewartii]
MSAEYGALFGVGVAAGISVAAGAQLLVNGLAKAYARNHAHDDDYYDDGADEAAADVAVAAPRKASKAAAVLSPLVPADADERLLDTFARLDGLLTVSSSALHQIVVSMASEFRRGLAKDGRSLKMIPSFVTSLPSGQEIDSVLALDLGGSNFRVCQVQLQGHGRVRTTQRKYTVPDRLKEGTGTELFDFFADCVAEFVREHPPAGGSDGHTLGFTFSFPVQQTSINHGTLMHWSKGFTASGVVGVDVVTLLQQAFERKKVKVNVTALVNDTVGTLVAHAYTNPQTYVGVILGTGTNAAYMERLSEVPKWAGGKDGNMIINTEWGAYDAPALPITEFDQALDRASANPKMQIFEKLISGMYLGEIVRIILTSLVASGELFGGRTSPDLNRPYHFETAYMSRIERDHSLELADTMNLFTDLLGISWSTLDDRRIVKHVCQLVGLRAARLSAAGIAAIVTKINCLDGCTVAIDGSLFEQYPHFQSRMRDALYEILGINADNIILEQARDGSGQGAALIALLHRNE